MATSADAVVIGAGPAGLAAGIYVARAGWNTIIVDKDPPGGQARQIERIENYPGFPYGISGRNLMERFVRQGRRWGVRFVRADARHVSRRRLGFQVRTTSGGLRCRALLLCSGAAFKSIGLKNEKRLKGIFQCAFEKACKYRGKDVAVAGGGEVAAHQALLLCRHARRVTLICRGRSLKVMRRLQRAVVAHRNIETLYRSVITCVHGRRSLRGISVRNLETKETSRLHAGALFVLIGKAPNARLLRWRKSPPGFFSAGDVRQGRFRQVAVAAGDGVKAAMSCERYLRGNR